MTFFERFSDTMNWALSLLSRILLNEATIGILFSVAFIRFTDWVCKTWDRRIFESYGEDEASYYAMYACRLMVGFVMQAVLFSFYNALMSPLYDSEGISPMCWVCFFLYASTAIGTLVMVRWRRTEYRPIYYRSLLERLWWRLF